MSHLPSPRPTSITGFDPPPHEPDVAGLGRPAERLPPLSGYQRRGSTDFEHELLSRLAAIERKLDSMSAMDSGSRSPRGFSNDRRKDFHNLVTWKASRPMTENRSIASNLSFEHPVLSHQLPNQVDRACETSPVKKPPTPASGPKVFRKGSMAWMGGDNSEAVGHKRSRVPFMPNKESMPRMEYVLASLGMRGIVETVRAASANPQSLPGWQFVHSTSFNMFCSFMIVLHSLFIGWSASTTLWARLDGHEPPSGIVATDVCFSVFFILELMLRLVVERWLFFCGPEARWNMVDFSLVWLSILDISFLLSDGSWSSNVGIGRVLRVVRFFRLGRLSRVIRNLSSLRLVLFAILDSMSSLFWCFVLIGIAIYIFAIIFLNAATEHFQKVGVDADLQLSEDMRQWYGGLYKSMLTLFMAISGGIDWGEAMRPVNEVYELYGKIFVFFMFVMHFGVLNVIVGTFVATATEIASKDREALVKCEIRQCQLYRDRIKTFFQEADLDRSGTLSWEEFKNHLNHQEVKAYFQTLDLDVSQAHMLFELLDTDGSNSVTIEEFLEGCMRLKGQAKSIDLNMLLFMTRKAFCQMGSFMEVMEERCETIEEMIYDKTLEKSPPLSPQQQLCLGRTAPARNARGRDDLI